MNRQTILNLRGALRFLVLAILSALSFTMQAQSTIPGLSSMHTVTLRLRPGQDVKQQLDSFIKTHNIAAACIVSCVGSLQRATIRYANQSDAAVLKGHFEIVSLSGTLAVSGDHLHISVSDSTGQTIGGHFKEGSEVYTTVEVVIGILSDVVFSRETDSTYGYKELQITPIKRKARN